MITKQEFEMAKVIETYDDYVRIMFQDIENVPVMVGRELGLPDDWMTVRSRRGIYPTARIVTAYILKCHYGMTSSTGLGALIGRGDHSIVHHYWKRANEAISGYDPQLKEILHKFDDIYSSYRKKCDEERKNIEESLVDSK